MYKYSVIVPVFNRPEEVRELLESLKGNNFPIYEILIIEDGSDKDCKHIVEGFSDILPVKYFFKENSGQGFSRNFGFEKALGDYFVVFDSDCIIPPNYFQVVDDYLSKEKLDAFGGPDKAAPDFTPIQKAISYSMTSPFTTGGIRGRKKRIGGEFHPRSFNMGISRQIFEKTKGYIITRMGEDIEFSIRIIRNGFKTGLIPEAFVYHKRRTNFKAFFKQLHFFGRARINVSRFFPEELKVVHRLPAYFVVGLIFYLSTLFFSPQLFRLGSYLLGFFVLIIFIDSTIKNKSVLIGFLSIVASFVQLTGYGIGMIQESLKKSKD